jgi:primary-amine oxidase
MLDGKHVIEAVVDLQNKKVLSWTPIKDAHGMVLLDDFASVQNIINASSEFAEVLKNTASTDPSKVITTPLTVGYFDGKDGLKQDARLLKVVSYLTSATATTGRTRLKTWWRWSTSSRRKSSKSKKVR